MSLRVPIYRDEAISRDCHTESILSGGLARTDAESVNKLFLGSLYSRCLEMQCEALASCGTTLKSRIKKFGGEKFPQ
jgi:hypothetical protein